MEHRPPATAALFVVRVLSGGHGRAMIGSSLYHGSHRKHIGGWGWRLVLPGPDSWLRLRGGGWGNLPKECTTLGER